MSLMIVKITVFTVVKKNEMHILASNQPLMAREYWQYGWI